MEPKSNGLLKAEYLYYKQNQQRSKVNNLKQPTNIKFWIMIAMVINRQQNTKC